MLSTARYGARLNARPIDTEAHLLSNVAFAERQVTLLFSVIALVAGIVLAYNALLLASGERRKFIVYLIDTGTPEGMVLASLAFDATVLGLAGAVVGLLAGELVSLYAYHGVPGYLAAAFPVGSQHIVTAQTVLIALGGAILAAFAATLLPALAILRAAASAEPEGLGRTLSLTRALRPSERAVFACGAVLVCGCTLMALLAPATTVVALVGLAAGLVICLPLCARGLLALARNVAQHSSDPAARLSVVELRNSPSRSVALLATGTIAAFLMIVIGGSVSDVQGAVRAGAGDLLSTAEIWVKPGGAENVYTTEPFASAALQARLSRLPGVSSVLPWRDSFLDLHGRRVWVLGTPPQLHAQIVGSQLLEGNLQIADAHLRAGGWVALSQTIAREKHLHLGERFSLPTPAGYASFRLAATTANYGWLSGAIVMNGAEHARLWGSSSATQLAVARRARCIDPGHQNADRTRAGARRRARRQELRRTPERSQRRARQHALAPERHHDRRARHHDRLRDRPDDGRRLAGPRPLQLPDLDRHGPEPVRALDLLRERPDAARRCRDRAARGPGRPIPDRRMAGAHDGLARPLLPRLGAGAAHPGDRACDLPDGRADRGAADQRDPAPRGVLDGISDDMTSQTMTDSAPPSKHTATPDAPVDSGLAADESTFAPAMRLLPGQTRADVRTLYGVLRTIDDLVDDDDPRAPKRVESLERWTRGWAPDSPEAHALTELAIRYPLPREQLGEFCRGMRHDIARATIADDADFDRYCQWAGGSVGIVLAVLLGAAGPEEDRAKDGMAALGRAMQVTNILRDIDEDLAARRVYISQSAIERFGFPAPGAREQLLRDHIARADALYEEGLPAIGLLAHGREAMALSAALYREILREIERAGFGRRPGRVVVPLERREALAKSHRLEPA